MLNRFKKEPHVGVCPRCRRSRMARVRAEFTRAPHDCLPWESCCPLYFFDGKFDSAYLLRLQKQAVCRFRPRKSAAPTLRMRDRLPEPVHAPPDHSGPQTGTKSEDFGDRDALSNTAL